MVLQRSNSSTWLWNEKLTTVCFFFLFSSGPSENCRNLWRGRHPVQQCWHLEWAHMGENCLHKFGKKQKEHYAASGCDYPWFTYWYSAAPLPHGKLHHNPCYFCNVLHIAVCNSTNRKIHNSFFPTVSVKKWFGNLTIKFSRFYTDFLLPLHKEPCINEKKPKDFRCWNWNKP